MSVLLYLNRAQDKIRFDRIQIQSVCNSEASFKVTYLADVTTETIKTTNPCTLTFDNRHDLLDYIEDVLDLLIQDKDSTPFMSIDVMIPAHPTVALKAGKDDSLLLSVLRSWCRRQA